MTTRQEVFIVLILSGFFAWCGGQFIDAQKSISRKLALDEFEESAIELVTKADELNEKYTRLTAKTFDNKGEIHEG